MQNWSDCKGQKLSRREMLEQWKRTREKQETPRKSLSMAPKPPKFEEVLRGYEPKPMKREVSASSKASVAKDIAPLSTTIIRRNSQLNTSMFVKSKIDNGRGKEKNIAQSISKSQSCKKFMPQQSPRRNPTQSVCKENVLKKPTVSKEISSQNRGNNKRIEKKISADPIQKISIKASMKKIIDNGTLIQGLQATKEQLISQNSQQAQIVDIVSLKSVSESDQNIPSDVVKEETKSNGTNETQCDQTSPQLLNGSNLSEIRIENYFEIQSVDPQSQSTQEKAENDNTDDITGGCLMPNIVEAEAQQSKEQEPPREAEIQDISPIQCETEVSTIKKKGSKKRKSPEVGDEKDENCLLSHRGALKKVLLEKEEDEATSKKLEEKVKIEFESMKSSTRKRAVAALDSQELQDDKYGLEMTLQEIEVKKGKNCVEKIVTSVRRSKRLNSVAKLTSQTWLK